jgi:membrane associated rhomboid family serine protease
MVAAVVWRFTLMKAGFREFLSLSNGGYLLLLVYAAVYPMVMAAHYARAFELGVWLDLSPALCWRGEIWRLVTYAFVPSGIVDWAVSLFWIVILLGVLGRNWSSRELWTYSLVAVLTGALVIVIVTPGRQNGVVGNAALVFGFLAAWYQLAGGERIVLPGIGRIKVLQAVSVIAIIEALICFVLRGWLVTLAMLCGGGAGWAYLRWRGKPARKWGKGLVPQERNTRL